MSINELRINFENEYPTVSSRELYKALEIQSNYTTWFKRMCDYGFTENIDYKAIFQKWNTAQGNETTQIDHLISIDMAKELCMIQRTELGKKFRKYFIDAEKLWNNPEAVLARALQITKNKLEEVSKFNTELIAKITQQEQRLEEAKPKTEFFDDFVSCDGTISIDDLAKVISSKANEKIGQKKLFKILREKHALNMDNTPSQHMINQGFITKKISTYTDINNNQFVSVQSRITPKGVDYIIKRLLNLGIITLKD